MSYVLRGVVGFTFADLVSVKNDFFTISVKSEQEIDSKKNYSVYFNPFESVGVGLQTGTDTSLGYHVGRSPKTLSQLVNFLQITHLKITKKFNLLFLLVLLELMPEILLVV